MILNLNDKSNKYVLITGATGGFGLEFCKLFARDGYNLILVSRSHEGLVEVAENIIEAHHVTVIPLAKDLHKPTAAREIYQTLKDLNIQVDILVNYAGQGEYGNFIEYDIDRDIDIIQLNITSLICLTKFFLKDMIERNEGKILQVSSLLGKYPTPLMAVYASTKAFILSFTEGLIHELKDTNITLTALLPGTPYLNFFNQEGTDEKEISKKENLTVPEEFAIEGYCALMRGESKIISGSEHIRFTPSA
jgi:short-subunit dehydrogenase